MLITLKDDNCELRLSDEMTEAGFINVIILGLSVGDVVNGTFSVDELRRAISSFEDQRTYKAKVKPSS